MSHLHIFVFFKHVHTLYFQGLSRTRDGLLVAEMDLNLCRQMKDRWCFRVGDAGYQN